MPPPNHLVTGVLTVAWIWHICSSLYSSYSISEKITPTQFGAGVKLFLTGVQLFAAFLMDVLPLSEFPKISLAHRLLSIPSQAYTLYYANKYIGPTLDSRRVTIVVAIISVLCVLETIYMISLDWSRIE